MKTYDETIDAIFSKGDALIEQRRQKAVKIKQTSYAVSGACAAAIVGVGIWRMNDLKKLPDNRLSEIETVEEITTTGTQTETYTTTSTVVTDTTKNTTASTSKNTVTSSSQTTTDKGKTKETTQSAVKTEITESASKETKNTESTAKQTTKHSETTTSQTEKATTADTTTMTTVQPDTTTSSITYDIITESISKQTTITTTEPVITSITTTQIASVIPQEKLCKIFDTIHLSEFESIHSKKKEQSFSYSYKKLRNDEVGIFIKDICLYGQYFDGTKLVDIENNAKIYEVCGCSSDVMLAVKLDGSDEYYLYFDNMYEPETLGDFLSAFNLSTNDLEKDCYYQRYKIEDIDTENVWNILTADTSLPNMTQYFYDNNITISSILNFNFNTTYKSWINGFIGINSQGYIVIAATNCIPYKCFFIGTEKANEIIEYYY